MNDVVITAALRTAVGKFNGSLAKVPASDLGAQIIKALLAHTGVKAEQISEVIMGQVLTAGIGQNGARKRPEGDASCCTSHQVWRCRDRHCRWPGKHECFASYSARQYLGHLAAGVLHEAPVTKAASALGVVSKKS